MRRGLLCSATASSSGCSVESGCR